MTAEAIAGMFPALIAFGAAWLVSMFFFEYSVGRRMRAWFERRMREDDERREDGRR